MVRQVLLELRLAKEHPQLWRLDKPGTRTTQGAKLPDFRFVGPRGPVAVEVKRIVPFEPKRVAVSRRVYGSIERVLSDIGHKWRRDLLIVAPLSASRYFAEILSHRRTEFTASLRSALSTAIPDSHAVLASFPGVVVFHSSSRPFLRGPLAVHRRRSVSSAVDEFDGFIESAAKKFEHSRLDGHLLCILHSRACSDVLFPRLVETTNSKSRRLTGSRVASVLALGADFPDAVLTEVWPRQIQRSAHLPLNVRRHWENYFLEGFVRNLATV